MLPKPMMTTTVLVLALSGFAWRAVATAHSAGAIFVNLVDSSLEKQLESKLELH